MNIKMVVTALVTLTLGALVGFHVVLPDTVDATSVVGVIMTFGSAAVIVFRFYHGGDTPADAKSPWASKTVWTGVVGTVFGVLAFFHIVPTVDQSSLVDVALVVVPGALALFGGTAKGNIA